MLLWHGGKDRVVSYEGAINSYSYLFDAYKNANPGKLEWIEAKNADHLPNPVPGM